MAATATALTREVKTVAISVVFVSFGLILGVSVINYTGYYSLVTAALNNDSLYHFRPLLPTSYA
jgi:hypothetical protein